MNPYKSLIGLILNSLGGKNNQFVLMRDQFTRFPQGFVKISLNHLCVDFHEED